LHRSGAIPYVEQFPAAGGEIDIFLVQKEDFRYILKLYHFGENPKIEILSKLHELGKKYPALFVSMVEYGFDDEYRRFYEIGEYLPAGNLRQLLEKGPLPEDQAFLISQTIFGALTVLHKNGILHLDLKPSNILIRDSALLQTVVSDFGASSLFDPDQSARFTRIRGTSLYQSPESLAGAFRDKSDWWALGFLIIEMVTGKHPFEGLQPQVVFYHLSTQCVPIPPLPARFSRIVKGLLIRDPDKRWGKPEVAKWIAGEEIPEVTDEASREFAPGAGDFVKNRKEPIETSICPPFSFQSKNFFSLETILGAMVSSAEAWEEGCRLLLTSEIPDWLKAAGNLKIAMRVEGFLGRDEPRDLILLRLQGTFIPDAPLFWRGQTICEEFFRLPLLKAAVSNPDSHEENLLQLLFSGKIHSAIEESKGDFPEKTERICSLAATLNDEDFPHFSTGEKAKFLYWTVVADSFRDPISLAIGFAQNDPEAGLLFRLLRNPMFLPWVRGHSIFEEQRIKLLEFFSTWEPGGFPANAVELLEIMKADPGGLEILLAETRIPLAVQGMLLSEKTVDAKTWKQVSDALENHPLLQKLLLRHFGFSYPQDKLTASGEDLKKFSPTILWCLEFRDEFPKLGGRMIPQFLEKAARAGVFNEWNPFLDFVRNSFEIIPQGGFSPSVFPTFPGEIPPTREALFGYFKENGLPNPSEIPWQKFGPLVDCIRLKNSSSLALKKPIYSIIPFLGSGLASLFLGLGTLPAVFLFLLAMFISVRERQNTLAGIQATMEMFSRSPEQFSPWMNELREKPHSSAFWGAFLSRLGIFLLVLGFLANFPLSHQIAMMNNSPILLYLS